MPRTRTLVCTRDVVIRLNPRTDHVARRGFSLLELLIVLSITVVLASLLMPALAHLRDNVHRVISASNMRQIGLATAMYAEDNNEMLPYSELLEQGFPEELMASHIGSHNDAWDGLGLLYNQQYCDSAEVFYSPSHHGNHPYHRYAQEWTNPSGTVRIYTNYHYGGHESWLDGHPRFLAKGEDLIVMTDGLRTKQDINHSNGLNMVHGDLSVQWHPEGQRIIEMLPKSVNGEPGPSPTPFNQIWRELPSADAQ